MGSLYRLNGDSFNIMEPSEKQKPGCRVTLVTGFILLLLGMVVVVGVAIIVHFAGARELVCHCGDHGSGVTAAPVPTYSPEALQQMCMDVIKNGNGDEICAVCPTTEGTVTTIPTTTETTEIQTTETPTTEIPTTPPPRDYRLPITVLPYLYSVELRPNIYDESSGFDFNGSVAIYTVAKTSDDFIVLHAHPSLTIEPLSIHVHHVNGSSHVLHNTTREDLRMFLTLHLTQNLIPDDHYMISMTFSGPLKQDGEGLYLSFYEEGGKKIYLATTQFQAPSARKAFPCFDEPALKAEFDITLVRQDGGERNYTSLSNTNSRTEHSSVPGMVKDVYERTVAMSTYLLAFVVCDYGYLADEASNVTYRTWAMPGKVQFAETAQMHGVEIFNRFAEYFKPVYVYDKLDNIAIPDFLAGAMENWGLITYRDILLYEPGVSSASNQEWIARVISHEIAHMWFGNLVSPLWWDWLWLSEGLATFWDYHIVGELHEDWNMLDMFVAGSMHSVMSSDALTTSHPLTADVMSPADISSIVDGVTYTKGSAVVRMMHLALGQEMFIEGLNKYLHDHAYGAVEHDDLWNALTQVANKNGLGLNMTEIMDPWATQMNYPVVSVEVSADRTKVIMTQKRFLLSGKMEAGNDTAKYGYTWTVPITFTTSENPDFESVSNYSTIRYMKYYNDKEEIAFDNPFPSDGWIIVNLKECGFFRVNYQDAMWNNIIDALNTNHLVIHRINRAQIINDAWSLAKAGILNQSIALNTLSYLNNEMDFAPWTAFSSEIGFVADMLERTSLFGQFQQFMTKTINGPLAALGMNITEGMTPYQKMFISHIVSLACSYDHQECVKTAKEMYEAWMADEQNNPIQPDLRSSFYCTAVRHGTEAEWNFAYRMFHNETTTSERARLRSAMSCTKEPWLLQRLLDMSVNPNEIRPQDTGSTISSVGLSRWGRELAWNFLKENYADISQGEASFSGLGRVIISLTKKFNTEQELQQIQDFVNSGVDTESGETAFKQAMEQTGANIKWTRDNYKILEEWLAKNI